MTVMTALCLQEAVLTALEAFLVSLYGFRPDGADAAAADPGAEEQASPERGLSSKQLETLHKEPDDADTEVSLHIQASNNSSSSSVAEDWIVNPVRAGLEPDFCLRMEETQEAAAQSRSEEGPGSDSSRELIPAEAWSRGTALSDPASGEPLQPVSIHTPSEKSRPEQEEPPRKPLNAITEKRAALTAFDLISSRAMRAPASPAALFEREARAAVLREQPAASLQEISSTVHQRWKNLREDERKK